MSKWRWEIIKIASCIKFNLAFQTVVQPGFDRLTCLTYENGGLLSKLGSLLHGTLFLMVKFCFVLMKDFL